MKIYRSIPTSDGIAIPVATLQDERLSYVARGVLCELLTCTDNDLDVNADKLSRRARQARGPVEGEGRLSMRAAFAELEEHGYLVRRRGQRANGRFITTLELFDTPGHAPATAERTADPLSAPPHRVDPQPVAAGLNPLPPIPRGEVLYRHWDENGVLLYVGVTRYARWREHIHAKKSPWMAFRAETSYEGHPSRDDSEAAEAAAIAAEKPLFNVAGNDDPEAPERLRRYLAEKNRLDLLPGKVLA